MHTSAVEFQEVTSSVNGLPFKIKLSIKKYTTPLGYHINSVLLARAGKCSSFKSYLELQLKDVDEHIDNLKYAISCCSIHHDMTIYTGLSGNGCSPEYSQVNKGERFIHVFNKFTSTTADQQVAKRFSLPNDFKSSFKGNRAPYKHYVEIRVAKNSHILSASEFSLHPHEQEFIIHPEAKVLMEATPIVDSSNRTVKWIGYLVHDGISNTEYANLVDSIH